MIYILRAHAMIFYKCHTARLYLILPNNSSIGTKMYISVSLLLLWILSSRTFISSLCPVLDVSVHWSCVITQKLIYSEHYGYYISCLCSLIFLVSTYFPLILHIPWLPLLQVLPYGACISTLVWGSNTELWHALCPGESHFCRQTAYVYPYKIQTHLPSQGSEKKEGSDDSN